MENHGETATARQIELPTLRFHNETPSTPVNENSSKKRPCCFEPTPRKEEQITVGVIEENTKRAVNEMIPVIVDALTTELN